MKTLKHHHESQMVPDWVVATVGLILCLLLFAIAIAVGGVIPVPG